MFFAPTSTSELHNADLLTQLLGIGKPEQKERIEKADADELIPMFAKIFEQDPSPEIRKIKIYAFKRIQKLQDSRQLQTDQVNRVKRLCLEKFSQVNGNEELKFQNGLIQFLRDDNVGPIQIDISSEYNDHDLNCLKNCFPALAAAVGKENIQINLEDQNICSIENLRSFINETHECIDSFHMTREVTDQGLLELLQNCVNLRYLRVESGQITGESLQQLIGQLPHLESLTLDNCPSITSIHLTGPANLKNLSFYSCPALASVSLTDLKRIERLSFWGEQKGTPSLANVTLAGLTGLLDLSFGKCECVSSIYATGLINLKRLEFYLCPSLNALPDLSKFGSLERLSLKECWALTQEERIKAFHALFDSNAALARFLYPSFGIELRNAPAA